MRIHRENTQQLFSNYRKMMLNCGCSLKMRIMFMICKYLFFPDRHNCFGCYPISQGSGRWVSTRIWPQCLWRQCSIFWHWAAGHCAAVSGRHRWRVQQVTFHFTRPEASAWRIPTTDLLRHSSNCFWLSVYCWHMHTYSSVSVYFCGLQKEHFIPESADCNRGWHLNNLETSLILSPEQVV